MDYNNLITKAFNISWKHKALWILGFFATSMGYFGGHDLKDFRMQDKIDNWRYGSGGDVLDRVKDWFEMNTELSIALIMFFIAMLLLLMLFFFVMNLISIAGLIGAVYKIEKNEKYKLGQLFKIGASYFWRFLGLFILSFIIGFTFVLLIIIPIVLAFIMTPVLGVLAILIGIPFGLAGIFFFGNIYSLAQREIVAYKTPFFKAIGEAYNLLIKHIGPNLVIFIITTILWIVIIIGAVIIAIIFAIPIVLLAAQSVMTLVLSLLIIVPVFLMVAVVVEGFLGTFFNSLMTLFYLELRKLTPHSSVPPPQPGPIPAQS